LTLNGRSLAFLLVDRRGKTHYIPCIGKNANTKDSTVRTTGAAIFRSGVPLFLFLLLKSDGQYCTFGGRLFF
jgi:hypothetical protein